VQNQLAEMPVRSVPVQQVIATTSEWIHVLGSDRSLYLVPTVAQTHSYETACCDAVLLKSLGISTSDAALLSWTDDLVLQAGALVEEKSDFCPQDVIGWRLPKGNAESRLLQILPVSWLPRVINREQFMEVLILDLWFRRAGKRQVIFEKTGNEIEAIFLPSGSVIGTQKCTIQQVGYYQTAVYNGLGWARIEASLKAKIASLTLADLGQQLRLLPRIDLGHEILKSLWFETMVNKVCFDQCLIDAVGLLFAGVIHTNHGRTLEVSSNRLRAISCASRGYPVGSHSG
jgi:hypothetical protein